MEVSLKRVHGGNLAPIIECVDTRYNFYRIRIDYIPIENLENEVSFIEYEFKHKPSILEIKDFVFSVINAQTDNKILNGFIWYSEVNNPINVWLSSENQRNFSEAYHIAEKNPELILPVTFKLGEDINSNPIYYQFNTFLELENFYLGAVSHINQCLAEGWQNKDSFDFRPYEEALN